MYPIGPSRRRLLYQSTHFKVSHSTSRIDFHGPIWLMRCLACDCLQSPRRTSVLKIWRRPWPQWGRVSAGMDDAFGQRIVVGVADGSDRKIDLGLGQALGTLDRQVLRSAIREVDQSLVIWCFSLPDCLLQRIEDKLCLHRCRGAPTDDPPCENVDDKRHVNSA